ncbi:MAG TPA: hypothetical protein VND45_08705 [Thermoanaerobaculia bacterium]|nr:hypothetical protein [Thermoanaerobaculia bacterium]
MTYKVDLITTDAVCLDFRIDNRCCVVDEETAGWEQLNREMMARFPVIEGWFGNVVQPAFATNRALLWDRAIQAARDRLDRRAVDELWRRTRADWTRDGSLRDIYIDRVTVDGWNDLVAVARGLYGRVTVSAEGRELLHDFRLAHFNGIKRASIDFCAGSLPLTAHCFNASQIELSFHPERLSSSTELLHLLDFLVAVTTLLGTPAVVTPENAPHAPILTVHPDGRCDSAPMAAG